jgi:hypothetical protein
MPSAYIHRRTAICDFELIVHALYYTATNSKNKRNMQCLSKHLHQQPIIPIAGINPAQGCEIHPLHEGRGILSQLLGKKLAQLLHLVFRYDADRIQGCPVPVVEQVRRLLHVRLSIRMSDDLFQCKHCCSQSSSLALAVCVGSSNRLASRGFTHPQQSPSQGRTFLDNNSI